MKNMALAVFCMTFVFTANMSALDINLNSFSSIPEIRMALDSKPLIGSWAEYESISHEKETMKIRYSVVGEEIVDGVVHSWVEWTVRGDDEEPSTIKILINSKLSEAGVPEKVIVKQGDKAPIDLPTALVKAGAWLSDFGEFLPGDLFSKSEHDDGTRLEPVEDKQVNIETESGEMNTHYLRFVSEKDENLELWLNEDIPFVALAKVRSDDYQLNLKDYGKSGAVSRIGADEATKSIGDLIKEAMKKK